jgi:hypothetical protein
MKKIITVLLFIIVSSTLLVIADDYMGVTITSPSVWKTIVHQVGWQLSGAIMAVIIWGKN